MNRLQLKGVVPLALLALGSIAAVCLYFGFRGPGLTAEMGAKVRAGMTLQEVEQVLGLPPGNYATGTITLPANGDPAGVEELAALMNGEGVCWVTNTGVLCVSMTVDGVVNKSVFRRAQLQHRSLSDLISSILRE